MTSPRSTESSQLYAAAEEINQLAIEVESNWHNLPGETKHFLRCVVYEGINPKNTSMIKRIWMRIKLFWAISFSDELAIFQWRSSIVRLNNSVLDAVELENEAFQADFTEAVESFNFKVGSGRRVR